MKPTSMKLIEDIRRLSSTVQIAGENELDHAGKIAMAEQIACICTELRRKYELTSQYFFMAEVNANKKYSEEYGEEE